MISLKQTTIYEIAKKAGVSPKTVSRVINNEPSVSKATYEKVSMIIKETNFLPNVSAQRLGSNKLKAIGLIIPSVSLSRNCEKPLFLCGILEKSVVYTNTINLRPVIV